MNLSKLDHFALLSRLPYEEKAAFAARCARQAVQILKGVSFPVAPADQTDLERVVRLAEDAATRHVDPAELQPALRDLGHLAFTSPAPCSFRSEVLLAHVAHAVYAAGLTALTGSTAYAQDTLDYAMEAARAAGAAEVEASIREGLHRIRKVPSHPVPSEPVARSVRQAMFA
jgi:hypothetical protein